MFKNNELNTPKTWLEAGYRVFPGVGKQPKKNIKWSSENYSEKDFNDADNIGLVLKGVTVDVYKNGLLTSSHPLSGTPKLNGSDLIINKKKGYEGAIQCVRWFSTALDANTILLYHRIYKEPLFFELAWDYVTGLEMPKPPSVKINLKVDVSVGKETSKDAKEKKIKKLRNKSN